MCPRGAILHGRIVGAFSLSVHLTFSHGFAEQGLACLAVVGQLKAGQKNLTRGNSKCKAAWKKPGPVSRVKKVASKFKVLSV